MMSRSTRAAAFGGFRPSGSVDPRAEAGTTAPALLAILMALASLGAAPPARAALSEYFVPPQQIDPAATQALEPHYVVIDRARARKGLLYVHLPGTNLAPQGSQLIVKAAALSGLHAIGLMYPDERNPNDQCESSADTLCYEKVHREYFEGVDASPLLTIGRPDSIEGRLVKLLQHLDSRFPEDGWGRYLDSSGSPAWSRISLGGFSQGSGHAAWIGHSRTLNRVALYAGPNETYLDGTLPGWISAAHATPTATIYAFAHQQDGAARHLMIWRALGLEAFGPQASVDGSEPPYGGSHMLYTDAPPADPNEFHKSVAVDGSTPRRADGLPLFAPVWSLVSGFDLTAAASSGVWILPSSARAAGAGGAFYTTDLLIANLGSEAATATLKFLGNGVDGRSGPEKTVRVEPGGSARVADVLGSLFGLTSGFGALRVTSPSPSLLVSGETSTPGFGGTFGQAVPAVGPGELATSAASRSILGIREDASFRTNLFLANATEAELAVDVRLVAASGLTLATKTYDLPALGMVQVTRVARDLGIGTDLVGGRLVVSTAVAGGSFAAYASTIDNTTNDPRTLTAR